ncbi:MAG: 3-isopropylmalate dehydratase small subunit [Pseudoclavibacter sp.]
MRAFTTHTGTGAPLERANVDTDQICPSVFLKRVTREGFDDALFAHWRDDPDFVLNRVEFASASVLVAGPDFGTGSSREHAVWALLDSGYRVVVSPRFADIFAGNCGKTGLLAATVAHDDVARLWRLLADDPAAAITVDLPSQTISSPLGTMPFEIDAYTKWRLLNGLDDIAITEQYTEGIERYERERPSHLPAVTPEPASESAPAPASASRPEPAI